MSQQINLVLVDPDNTEHEKFLYEIIEYRWANHEIINLAYRTDKTLPTYEIHQETLKSLRYKHHYIICLGEIKIGSCYIDREDTYGMFILPTKLKEALKLYGKKGTEMATRPEPISVIAFKRMIALHPEITTLYAAVNPKNTLSRNAMISAGHEEQEIILTVNTVNPFEVVEDFEKTIASIAGSKYAIAVDCCTNALFLCLKYLNQTEQVITIPSRTYVGVPSSIRNAGYKVQFEDVQWSGTYQLKPLPIIDGALRFRKNMYEGGFHCLSFHIKKHLKIGRGGMILTDDSKAKDWFKLARFNGRNSVEHYGDSFKMIGWNYYMTNYDAARGLWLLAGMPTDGLLPDIEPVYPDLSVYDFNNQQPGEYFK
jgi:hypothetical protein